MLYIRSYNMCVYSKLAANRRLTMEPLCAMQTIWHPHHTAFGRQRQRSDATNVGFPSDAHYFCRVAHNKPQSARKKTTTQQNQPASFVVVIVIILAALKTIYLYIYIYVCVCFLFAITRILKLQQLRLAFYDRAWGTLGYSLLRHATPVNI